MKRTLKKVFKKVVALSSAAAVMISCASSAFAISGIIPKSDEDLSSVLKFSSDGTDLSLFSTVSGELMNAENTADGAIQLGTQYKLSNGNYYAQSYTKGLNCGSEGKTVGLAFKVMADSENASDKMFITVGSGSTASTYKTTTEVFPLDNKGNIGIPLKSGSTDTTGWPDNIGSSTMKTSYTKGVWQDAAIVLDKENATVTAYVDGEKLGTANAGKPDSLKNGDFHFMFHVEGAQSAKFYLDDIKYVTDTSRLVAAANTSTIAKGATVAIDFSSLIENKDEVSQPEVFESTSGSKITSSASFDGQRLNVNMTGATADGAEYRIELPNYKDAFGNELYNNSIYVNTEIPQGEQRTIDLRNDNFEDYTSTAQYAAPNGWTKSYQWMSGGFNNTFMQSQTDSDEARGTAVLLKKDATSSSGNDLWSSGGMYLPLPSKISTGKVTISYDFKPIKYRRGGNTTQNRDVYWETNFAFGVYADAPGATTAAIDDSCCAILQAVKKTQLGFALDKIKTGYDNWQGVNTSSIWHTYEELDTDGSPWDLKEDVSIENPKWYNIAAELDFDKKKVTYYVDGVKTAESDTVMNNVGTVTSGAVTNPISNGIVGIGFGYSPEPIYSEQLIDNVKVTRSLGELGDEVIDFAEDFNTYGDTGNGDVELKNGCSEGNVLTPNGWSQGWIWTDNDASGNSDNVVTRPVDVSADNREKAVKIGKTNTGINGWDTPYIYHSLNREYTSGIMEFEYEFNPYKAVVADKGAITSSGFNPVAADKAKPFQVGLFANKWDFAGRYQTAEQGNTDNVGTSNMIKRSNDKVILGIEGTKLNAYGQDEKSATAVADITNNNWYKIKHTIDIDFGTIKTYLYENNDWTLKAETTMSDLGLSQIGGIGFLCVENALNSETYIDNVKVSYRGEKAKGGVSAVRFGDCFGNIYGTNSALTTLVDKVAISFVDTPDINSLNSNTVKFLKDGTAVDYSGEFKDGAYVMTLSDMLDKNSVYTISVDGVTVGGADVSKYEMSVQTEENGVRIIEPIKMYINDVEQTEQNVSIKKDDKVKATIDIIDTTGAVEQYNFSAALYNGDTLNNVDFVDIAMGGTNAKRKQAVCEFTADENDAANLTKIKAFLWGGYDKLTPFMAPAEFTVTK